MKLIRSWPANPPANPHVIDDAARLLNDRYDYSGLADVGDDVLHVDWDMAVSRDDLIAFAAAARTSPGRVLVAPYPIYPDSRRGLPAQVWAAKRYEDGESRMRYVDTGEPTCHMFGFGMVYLPRDLIRGFVDRFVDQLQAGSAVMDDISFSGWHHREVEPEARIAWHVRPVHLHYSINEVPL